MIDYETYCKIRHYHSEKKLSFAQNAVELGLHAETASKYARMEKFVPRVGRKRSSKLDAFKPMITRLLERYPYSAAQLLIRLREEGYTGGSTILNSYVLAVRPVRHRAFLTLAFEPGEAAQVDWGSAGSIQIGETRRRLSFFVMVLCHSRMIYVEFTCQERLEHFLGCHKNAFEFFGGTPRTILIDNLKTGVLSHPLGEAARFHPRYADFAAHYGFEPRACNVRRANEKGRVENGVGYVKKNLLAGLDIPSSLSAMNAMARRWMEAVANVRIHAETRKPPIELFGIERPALHSLPSEGADTSITRTVRVTNRCRVVFDANRYSVPCAYVSQRLILKAFSDRLCFYHQHNLIASHPRSYERGRDFENPDHVRDLLDQRRRARESKWLQRFYAMSPHSEYYHQQLNARSLNARHHVNKIVALADIYGDDKVASAIRDAVECQAFACQYIENILQQRERITPQPGPLHLTRRSDLLDIELTPVDLSPYELPNHTL